MMPNLTHNSATHHRAEYHYIIVSPCPCLHITAPHFTMLHFTCQLNLTHQFWHVIVPHTYHCAQSNASLCQTAHITVPHFVPLIPNFTILPSCHTACHMVKCYTTWSCHQQCVTVSGKSYTSQTVSCVSLCQHNSHAEFYITPLPCITDYHCWISYTSPCYLHTTDFHAKNLHSTVSRTTILGLCKLCFF